MEILKSCRLALERIALLGSGPPVSLILPRWVRGDGWPTAGGECGALVGPGNWLSTAGHFDLIVEQSVLASLIYKLGGD